MTTAATLHQNDISECKNQTLFEAVRRMFNTFKFPAQFLIESLRAVNYVLNRCATCSLNPTTPHERLYDVPPDLTLLIVILCIAYVHIPSDKRTKLQPKAKRCLLVGYDDESKAYRCQDPLAYCIVTSNDVTFFEHIPGNFVDAQNFVDLFSGFDAEDDLTDPILP